MFGSVTPVVEPYFFRREAQERAAAAAAPDPSARRAHLDLAERYALLTGRRLEHAAD